MPVTPVHFDGDLKFVRGWLVVGIRDLISDKKVLFGVLLGGGELV